MNKTAQFAFMMRGLYAYLLTITKGAVAAPTKKKTPDTPKR